MHPHVVALAVLLVCIASIRALSKADLVGPTAVVGFVLGAASAVSVVALVNP